MLFWVLSVQAPKPWRTGTVGSFLCCERGLKSLRMKRFERSIVTVQASTVVSRVGWGIVAGEAY